MAYDRERRENVLYASLGQFLRSIAIPVPQILAHDEGKGFVMLEDLGDRDLWSYRGQPWEERALLYQRTLETIYKLHAYPVKDPALQALPLMEGFDDALYRWERDYFREFFVGELGNYHLSPDEGWALEKELAALAKHLLEVPRRLIHRDFQSQNVMIRGGQPYLIDFQGMRLGNPLYDLASLLYDPYVSLSPEERMYLAHYYYALSFPPYAWEDYCIRLWETAAQRLMQALGAYGFLALKKGRREFLQYVPPALGYLIAVTGCVPTLPHLHILTLRLALAMDLTGEEEGDISREKRELGWKACDV